MRGWPRCNSRTLRHEGGMRIQRPRRLGRALAMLAIVALVSAAARAIWSNGMFSTAKTGFSGSCKVVGNLPGVQDAEIANGVVFLSVGSARGPAAADGIYALPLAGGGSRSEER